MKNLFCFFRDYKKEGVLAPLFKLLEALFELLVPLYVAKIINNGIHNADYSYIIKQFAMLIVLASIGLTCSITAQYFSAKASVGFATKLRKALFDHIQSLSYKELDTIGTDTLITRMTSDVNQIQNGLNLLLRLLLRSPFIVFGAMIMAFTIDLKSAIIFTVTIPVLAVVVFAIMLISIPMFKKVQKALDNVLSSTRENLTGVRVIRAFRREYNEIKLFDEKNNLLTKLNEKVGRISALMNPMTYALINIATIILIYVGACEVNLGVIKQGDVVALYNYMAQIVVELIKLASLIITVDKSLACAGRVSSVLDIKPSMHYALENKTNSDYAISFDNVCFAYAGSSEPALENISFNIKASQTLGIIGGTGSGKSTLANLIARFYDANSGNIIINGKDIKSYEKNQLTSIIGVVPQKAVLFHGSIRDNMRLGNENATDEQIFNALKIAQAENVVNDKKGKLDFIIEQNGRNLSGGQKQRLTIARAIVNNPSILIMDDSASALDFATDASLRNAVSKLDMTTVIISQRTSSIMNSDLILVLDDGKIAGQGSHQELMKNCRIYQEIYYSQFPKEKPLDFEFDTEAENG